IVPGFNDPPQDKVKLVVHGVVTARARVETSSLTLALAPAQTTLNGQILIEGFQAAVVSMALSSSGTSSPLTVTADPSGVKFAGNPSAQPSAQGFTSFPFRFAPTKLPVNQTLHWGLTLSLVAQNDGGTFRGLNGAECELLELLVNLSPQP